MIGRKKEQEDLLNRYRRNKAEFIALYGRRRVGKTTLVDETFQGNFAFRHAALSTLEKKGAMQLQIDHFYQSLKVYGLTDSEKPTCWMDAFYLLENLLQQNDDGARQVVFIDEMPWMDTPRSRFVMALEGFWNNWACHRKNVMLIVCGSDISWMLDNLINNHGGLYGRITEEIRLLPFSLSECEQLYLENEVHFSRYDIAQSYMFFGGIPYYLDAIDKQLSLAENVDQLIFAPHATFRDEYDGLFSSSFSNPETMKLIIEKLYTRRGGYARKELSAIPEMPTGGALTAALNALADSDFIEKYVPFGAGKRETCYRLIDPFCLFWLHFVKGQQISNETYWVRHQFTPAVAAWRDLAFENVCFHHIPQIKRALGIRGVVTSQAAWILHDQEKGSQIDMLIERNDHVINACEIKYSSDAFTVDKAYYRELQSRQETLLKHISRRSAIYQTLISTYGLHRNEYAGIFTQIVTLDDLFEQA